MWFNYKKLSDSSTVRRLRFFKRKKTLDIIQTSFNEMRQLPTLPVSHPTGTLGSIRLNFCVRNVNRCVPYDMTTAMAPRTGLEPVTIRLTAERSTYWATEDHAFFAYAWLLTHKFLRILFCLRMCSVLRPVEQRQLPITYRSLTWVNLVNALLGN